MDGTEDEDGYDDDDDDNDNYPYDCNDGKYNDDSRGEEYCIHLQKKYWSYLLSE
jgi:hypothetical protein